MTEDSNLIVNLKYLDDILYYLIMTQTTYTSTVTKLSDDIFNLKLDKIKDLSENDTLKRLFEEYVSSNNEVALTYKVLSAIQYLIDENLITLFDNDELKITYKGIIKYSEGFVMEYQKHSSDKIRLLNVESFQRKMSRWMLFVNGAIAVGTVVAMVYYILEMISTAYCFCK